MDVQVRIYLSARSQQWAREGITRQRHTGGMAGLELNLLEYSQLADMHDYKPCTYTHTLVSSYL